MIDLEALVAWFSAVNTDLAYTFVAGPRVPEFGNADVLGVVTPLEGPGLTLDGLASVASFQVRMIGREYQHTRVRKSAFQVDDALLFGVNLPDQLWGTRIQYIDRLGGEPAPVQEDELDRVAYLCSYVAHETPER